MKTATKADPKNTVAAAPVATNNAPANNGDTNRSELIRAYATANPGSKPADIVAGVKKAHGIEVSSSLVSSVLSRRSGSKVDVEGIKSAAAFIKGFKGGVPEAKKAIESVGHFIDDAGSASSAIAALEAYEALASAIGN